MAPNCGLAIVAQEFGIGGPAEDGLTWKQKGLSVDHYGTLREECGRE